MAKKATASLPAALAESIKSSIHALEVQINLLKRVLGAPAKGKAKPADEEEEEVDEPEVDEDEADANPDDEEPEEEESEEEDEPEEEEEDDEGPTLKDLKKALSKFSARGEESKNKAVKILKKYKVKHVDDLPKSKYAEVIKQLK